MSDYPARLDIEYSQSLPRGLVLVKWSRLALPQYVMVAVFAGGWVVWTGTNNEWLSLSVGLIGLLVALAVIVLLFNGRCPKSIYELVFGMTAGSFASSHARG